MIDQRCSTVDRHTLCMGGGTGTNSAWGTCPAQSVGKFFVVLLHFLSAPLVEGYTTLFGRAHLRRFMLKTG